jgi:hypothetical protein
VKSIKLIRNVLVAAGFACLFWYEYDGGLSDQLRWLGPNSSIPPLVFKAKWFVRDLTGGLLGGPTQVHVGAPPSVGGGGGGMMPTVRAGIPPILDPVITGTISPALAKFLTPELLTTDPVGTRSLSPADRRKLESIMNEARANPVGYLAEIAAMNKARQAPP